MPRRLRVFAFDPATGNAYANRATRELTIRLPWELDPVPTDRPFVGPSGDYLEIIDYDPASGVFYDPIDLNDAKVLLGDGLTPSEENPQFHQQMVYAVAMNTIANFETALGRVALWSPRRTTDASGAATEEYVGRLRVYPHALREANAYYDPEKKALLFGYFEAAGSSSNLPPGSTVFTCLSHDIIVHETCHALLDGLHPYFTEASNPDVLALHEGFSDIVAILQHFSFPAVLEEQIGRARGDLQQQTLLAALAQEFGLALGRGGALRDAIGHVVDGVWRMRPPDNRALEAASGAHGRGAILVTAVFRAFLLIYEGRTADLIRIATGGSGVLSPGAIDPDLVRRLADEAAKSARHLLQMCVRALDYCPPVDVTFGDYLRALVTADHDLYPGDERGYRRAVIEAFTSWGIVPEGMPIVNERTLLWPTFQELAADLGDEREALEGELGILISQPTRILEELKQRGDMTDSHGSMLIQDLDDMALRIAELMSDNIDSFARRKKVATLTPGRISKEDVISRNLLELGLAADREVEFHARRFYAKLFWGVVTNPRAPELQKLLGLSFDMTKATIVRSPITNAPEVEVTSVRMANRIGDRGQTEREYVVELFQSRHGYFDAEAQAAADAALYDPNQQGDFLFRSGATLLIDAKSFEVRRIIRARSAIDDEAALARARRHWRSRLERAVNAFDAGDLADGGAAFAMLHRHVERDEA